MDETRVFKNYSDRFDPRDMEFLYDYAAAGYYEDTPVSRRRYAPQHEMPAPRVRQWIKEQAEDVDEIEARPISRRGQGVSLLTLFGIVAAAAMLVLMLFSHIELTALSESAANCQTRITELTEQQHKLQARYETSFALSEVERYAVEELGMQKPRADQVVYLDDLGDVDRSEIVDNEEENVLSLAIESVTERVRAYFG